MNDATMIAVSTLGVEAEQLADERMEYMRAKQDKAKAENAVMEAIIEAVRPAFTAISSSLDFNGHTGKRGILLGDGLYLDERGDFFTFKSRELIQLYTVEEVLNRTSLSAVLAVLLTAVRAQTGKLDPRTDQIRREASILEGIAMAFKVGGVR